ncbi:MAG: TonB family protein [Deltaproteobacteria bacterium]|nr:TonB family protein [Deltaproteobacteria bacterium]
MQDSPRYRPKTVVFLLLSLLLHAVVLTMPRVGGKKKQSKTFVVQRINLEDLPKEQVVDATEPKNNQIPDRSKYLSKQNQSVPKETQAKHTGKTKNTTSSLAVQKNGSKPSSVKETSPKLKLSDLGLKAMPRKPAAVQPSSPGPSQTDDYLPGVKLGSETALNTREFQFYSYFERIKDRLRMYWEPELRRRIQHAFSQGAEISSKDLITQLHITLNKNGELSKISITKPSGIDDIDGAALFAFEQAAPFPNPPTGMIEKNGEVILTWSFVVQTKGIPDIFVFLSKL